ncbi:hypothetical protein ACSMXM_05700 [Pacificimonas sp. ICDLI1SI03]
MAEVITLKRWNAEITYRHAAKNETRVTSFEELFELHDIIERGPSFYAIENIVIRPSNRCPQETVDMEEVA